MQLSELGDEMHQTLRALERLQSNKPLTAANLGHDAEQEAMSRHDVTRGELAHAIENYDSITEERLRRAFACWYLHIRNALVEMGYLSL